MTKPNSGAVGVIVALVILAVAAWHALGYLEERYPEAVKQLKSVIFQGFGLAIAAVVGLIALGSAPWWIAAAVAGSVLVGTGAWTVAADALGLPSWPGSAGGSGGGDCPPGVVCLGTEYSYQD